MFCQKCSKQISFNQWYTEMCHWYEETPVPHLLSNSEIRQAYTKLLEEATYSRSQP